MHRERRKGGPLEGHDHLGRDDPGESAEANGNGLSSLLDDAIEREKSRTAPLLSLEDSSVLHIATLCWMEMGFAVGMRLGNADDGIISGRYFCGMFGRKRAGHLGSYSGSAGILDT